MNKITDKYHKLIKEDEKRLSPLFDLKEVPKRVYQFGIAALLTGAGLSIYDSFLGLHLSSFLLGCFCFAIMLFIFLKYNEAIQYLPAFIISTVCATLIVAACFEGFQSEQYLYFFPLLVAVPIIIDLKQTKSRQSVAYILIIILSFLACIIIDTKVPHIEDFTLAHIGKVALINRIVAVSSTILLSLSYIFFERKYIKELMEQSTRIVDSRTQFLATMGHELRTPLNGIIGTINLLKKQHSPAQQDEYMRVLQYCSDNMLQQVNKILDFNQIEVGELEIHPKEVNLLQLLSDAETLFIAVCNEKGLSLKLQADNELDISVIADDRRLIQVLSHLLSNAVKFTEKGLVKLSATCKDKTAETITVNFAVEDTGVGIDKEDQGKLFDSFWHVYDETSQRLTGTRLGLTISARLLKLMDSKLMLVSERGTGSKFSFDISFKHAAASEQPVLNEDKAGESLSGVRVLLAEDNEINMLVATHVLENYNAIVTPAHDGKEALEKLEEDHNQDVILMDLQMPVMNGYTAMEEAKKRYPKIPVIAFTASLVDQKMLADLLASGFADCLLKPYQPQQMFSIINKHLAHS